MLVPMQNMSDEKQGKKLTQHEQPVVDLVQ